MTPVPPRLPLGPFSELKILFFSFFDARIFLLGDETNQMLKLTNQELRQFFPLYKIFGVTNLVVVELKLAFAFSRKHFKLRNCSQLES